jgi:hypothetical protein
MDEIKPLLLLISSGLLLRFSLTLTGQAWAKSHSQTVAFVILPIITYVITKTISGNIALSLGMIGALSIVRFRHPVKSALELIMYFDLITIGIAASVRTKWAIQLVLVSIIVIISVRIIQIISNKYGKSFYSMSFNEGIVSNTIEVISKNKIDLIEDNDHLVSYLSDASTNKYVYRLNFNNRNSLKKFKEAIKNDQNIEKINIIYN